MGVFLGGSRHGAVLGGDRTLGTAPEDTAVAMTHGTGAAPVSVRPSSLMVAVHGEGGPRVRSRVPSSWWAPAFRGWMFSLLSAKLTPPPRLGQQILLLPPAAVPELQVPDARAAQRDEGAGGPEEGAPPRLLQYPQGTRRLVVRVPA